MREHVEMNFNRPTLVKIFSKEVKMEREEILEEVSEIARELQVSIQKAGITKLARDLFQHWGDMFSPIDSLIIQDFMNYLEIPTTYGTPYKNGRGIFRLVATTVQEHGRQSNDADAVRVARLLVKNNGEYAFEPWW